jgi:hypothetical protein
MKKKVVVFMTLLALIGFLIMPMFAKAQAYVPINGDVFREGIKINPPRTFGVDTILGMVVLSDSSAGIMLRTPSDTTMMYQKEDTARLFTTAAAWKFTPAFNDFWVFDKILTSDSNVLYNNFNKYPSTVFIKGVSQDTINGGVEINGTSTHQLGVKITGAAIDTNQSDIMLNPLGGTIRIDNLPNEGNANAIYLIRNTTTNELSWYEHPNILTDTATLDFPALTSHGHEDLTITVTGAELSDVVSLGIPNSSIIAEVLFTAYVSATDTVTVRAQNVNGGTPDPASGLFKVKVFK